MKCWKMGLGNKKKLEGLYTSLLRQLRQCPSGKMKEKAPKPDVTSSRYKKLFNLLCIPYGMHKVYEGD